MSRRWPKRSGVLPMLLLVLGTGAWGLIAFGPDRAMRLAAAAASNVLLDGLAEGTPSHRIPVVDVVVSERDLEELGSDLPWSGGRTVDAEVIDRDGRHPAGFRYRGMVVTTHFLGGKKSFRLTMEKGGPFPPYRRLNFINPKAFNMVNAHLAYWVAGRMGVSVPFDDLAFVRINGRAIGVMEVVEQPDGDFERNRHRVDHRVPVFKGDYPTPVNRRLLTRRELWRDARHWEHVGGPDSTAAWIKLRALIDVIGDPDLPWTDRRDTLERLIDVDAFLRFAAAIKVIDTQHIDNYHNQVLVLSPRTGLFVPVLWDPLMMFPPDGEPFYPVHDALAFWLLCDPEWRWRRDQYVHDALVDLHRDGAFAARLDEVLDRLLPSVLADRNKTGVVSPFPQDVLRISSAHWAMSAWRLRTDLAAYWERLLNEFDQGAIRIGWDAEQGTIKISGLAVPQLSITVVGDSLVPDRSGGSAWRTDPLNGSITVFPDLAEADAGGAFSDVQRYRSREADLTLRFPAGRIRSVTLNGHGP